MTKISTFRMKLKHENMTIIDGKADTFEGIEQMLKDVKRKFSP